MLLYNLKFMFVGSRKNWRVFFVKKLEKFEWKIISLAGSRPQFIKEAIINKELKKKESLKEIIVLSGQLYDFNMSDVFFKVLNIQKPDYFLNVGSGLHIEMTG